MKIILDNTVKTSHPTASQNSYCLHIIFKILIFFQLISFSQEAYMSQVHTEELIIPLDQLCMDSPLIFLAEDQEKSETYRETIFPKETHHQRKEKYIYREYMQEYKVLETLKGDLPPLQKNIWVLKKQDYDLESIRRYHEDGLEESPIVSRYKPTHKIEGKNVILFLDSVSNSSQDNVYFLFMEAMEGTSALEKIKSCIKATN